MNLRDDCWQFRILFICSRFQFLGFRFSWVQTVRSGMVNAITVSILKTLSNNLSTLFPQVTLKTTHKSSRSTSSISSVSRKGKSTSVVRKKYKESYHVMGGFEQRPWTPTKRRGPIAAEHRGPGPQYLLPQLLGESHSLSNDGIIRNTVCLKPILA